MPEEELDCKFYIYPDSTGKIDAIIEKITANWPREERGNPIRALGARPHVIITCSRSFYDEVKSKIRIKEIKPKKYGIKEIEGENPSLPRKETEQIYPLAKKEPKGPRHPALSLALNANYFDSPKDWAKAVAKRRARAKA